MSKSDVFENDWLKLLFNNTPIAGIGDAGGILGSAVPGSFWVSLHTADPGEAGNQGTNETVYTGYARLSAARGPGSWTVTGNSVSPTINLDFAECTALTATITHVGIGSAAAGAGKLLYSGILNTPISVLAGVIPRVKTTTTITED